MRSFELRLFAGTSLLCGALLLTLAPNTAAATKPRYGGTLRVELRATSVVLDPRKWQPGSLEYGTDEKLGALVFERLVALDNYGSFQPALATEWSHDGSYRRWQFVIRAVAKFSDGTPLSSADVVTALQPLLSDSLKISASGNTVAIQSAAPLPDLLEQLASGRYFVYRVAADGALVGTGPFVAGAPPAGEGQPPEKASAGTAAASRRAAESHSGAHLFFRANEEAWPGRPFLDAIEVSLGVPALRAMFDLQLGKADLVELAPELVPRATQANLRVWTSDPVTLYALRFEGAQGAESESRLREALSLSLDRDMMASVLLQRQAEPASALLPQWLSGYAFLFNMGTNLERAKELRRTLPAGLAAGTNPLRLRVDSSRDTAKLLGERVALNARQVSILVQVAGQPGTRPAPASSAPLDPPPGAHLFAWRYSSLSPRVELDSMLAAYNLGEPQEANVTNSSSFALDQEQLYAREKRVLEDRRVVPLVEQAESAGLATAVRDWMPARWGEWRLADVWLDSPPTSSEAPAVRAAAPGAKP